jgi:hypothetical protein
MHFSERVVIPLIKAEGVKKDRSVSVFSAVER